MTALSVNLNKIALLRNSRELDLPSVVEFAHIVLDAGAQGITIHPRPDERHIRSRDVGELAELLQEPRYRDRELNIEGNPFEGRYLEHVRAVRPAQCTLVPDSPDQPTSDHGWDPHDVDRLRPVVGQLKDFGCRVSLFVDADTDAVHGLAAAKADRVELYTEPYARAFKLGAGELSDCWRRFSDAAAAARSANLGINAGHDLNLDNLDRFLEIPNILEVSIGHALTAEALKLGMAETVKAYLAITGRAATTRA